MGRKSGKFADERGASAIGWAFLGALVLLAIAGLVVLFVQKNQRNAAAEYEKYLPKNAATKVILTEKNVADAQNKAANDGALKSGWKPKSALIGDVVFGNPDAKVKVVEYVSPACSACYGFSSTAAQIADRYKNDITLTYRFFNPFAGQSASASAQHVEGATAMLAANFLGGAEKFWAMEKLIYSPDNNGVCTDTNQAADAPAQCRKYIDKYAAKLGLDAKKFAAYMTTDNSNKNGISDKIARDQKLGENAGVNGTPTWIVDGRRLDNTTRDANSAIEKAVRAHK